MNKHKTDQINDKVLTNQLLEHLDAIEIPKELDEIVRVSIEQGKKSERIMIMKKWFRNSAATAAALIVGFVGATNLSPTFAQSLSDIPVLNTLAKVVSFRQFDYHEDTYEATIDTPMVEGLTNKDLETSLNQKYLEENKKLYEQFEKEVADMKAFEEGGHLGIASGFEIKTNNDQILSIARYIVNTVGSSSTTITYDTIDKQNELLLTLPSLFKDDSYIQIISDNIKEQMRTKRASDPSLVYWIAGETNAIDGFDLILADQSFYITDEGKLVISFDKYAVGPGSMGIQVFEIPTELIQPILVSNTYIK